METQPRQSSRVSSACAFLVTLMGRTPCSQGLPSPCRASAAARSRPRAASSLALLQVSSANAGGELARQIAPEQELPSALHGKLRGRSSCLAIGKVRGLGCLSWSLSGPETQALAKVGMSQVMAGKLAWDPVKGRNRQGRRHQVGAGHCRRRALGRFQLAQGSGHREAAPKSQS